MNREIPGFYYDSVKRKYFRIEDNKTAPAGASWSQGSVKRRAVEQKEVKESERKEVRGKEGVKRTRLSTGGLVVGGLLRREVKSDARCEDVPVKVWAGGLREKGETTLWLYAEEDQGMVTALWVGPQEDGNGIVCAASSNSPRMVCTEIIMDEEDRINDKAYGRRSRVYGSDGIITSIKFHQLSQTSVMVGSRFDGENQISIRQPRLMETEGPSWLADATNNSNNVLLEDFILNVEIHGCEISPLSTRTNVDAIFATNSGLLSYRDNDIQTLTYFESRKMPPFHQRPPFHGDILSVDYLRQDQQSARNTILAGTRSGHICLIDRRTSPKEWESTIFQHKSSVAHLKSLPSSPHEVLVAGPHSAMAIYDIRFLQNQKSQKDPPPPQNHRPWDRTAMPIVTFPGYRNEAHIKTGLDVLTEPGYGCGVVAAAHDDCTVGVYSLRDGSRLPAGDVDKIKAPAVIRSMMWQTLPGDSHPSLFVGHGAAVKKCSF
ncbi:WD repeat-containing protein 21 [Cladorrhinum sp. PSN332]|nr:WD repeat-containing protein 21 [Cladorrhinum sp. PSN332]